MTSLQLLLCTFILGFGVGIITSSLAGKLSNDDMHQSTYPINTDRPLQQRGGVNLDPFPLPPCNPNRTSAVYVFYGYPIQSVEGDILFNSIKTLLKSNFPGLIRVVIDQRVNETIREEISHDFTYLLDEIELKVVSMPDLNGKELIPHSNKIRALQAGALVYGNHSDECTVSLDSDTYVHSEAPWNMLLSALQLNDIAVARDCQVDIAEVPDFLSHWMPNTGVLALRNTPRTRMVLRDWLHHFVPCNATHVSTCTPGTDQYPFLQLAVKHAVRLHQLDNSWNCRLNQDSIAAGIEGFPIHSVNVLSKQPYPISKGGSITTDLITTCGGSEECHILHGHWLKFP